MKIKIKKWNFTTTFLFLTILSIQNFAQLIPSSSYLIPGLLKFSDIGVITGVLFTIWCYCGIKTNKPIEYRYRRYIFVFFIMVVISAIMSNIKFGQPISYGIRSLRLITICFLLYFPITKALQLKVIKKENLISILFIVGTLEFLVYTLQYFLAGKVQFTYLNTTELRYDATRLRVPYLLLLILGLYCLDRLLTNHSKCIKTKLVYLGYVAWSVMILAMVCKHRTPTAILVCTIGIAYLLWKKDLSTKFIVGILVVLLSVGVISNSQIVNGILDGISNIGGTNDTLSIRSMGQLYYFQKLKSSLLFGYGFPNTGWPESIRGAGEQYAYYLADNGVMGFFYVYGLLGIIWIIMIYITSFRMSWRLYKRENIYFYLLYFIFETANLYIGLHWYYYYHLPFIMVIILLEDETRNFINRR